jgi:ferredoxin
VQVDPAKCQGHMRCVTLLPQVFEETDEGLSSVPDPEVPEELQGLAQQAARACPEQAIVVSE